MLQIVDSKKERFAAQKALERGLRSNLPRIGRRELGFQGGNERMVLYSQGSGHLFFASYKTDGQKGIERYWNAFGFLDGNSKAQDITVEINIAIKSTSRRVSAFFARDRVTGREYLFHSGKIGGGYKGVGQYTFLAWCKKKLMTVYDDRGNVARLGIMISAVEDKRLVARIYSFVNQVAAFKRAVRQGTIDSTEIFGITEEIDRYSAEFAGRKKGRRLSLEIDYVSVHGDIVDALMNFRSSAKNENEIVANTNLIDLYVKKAGYFSEIYEVKPYIDQYSIYTAIGQLLVHGNLPEKPTLHLVVPDDEEIPEDIKHAMSKLHIKIIRYSSSASGAYSFA